MRESYQGLCLGGPGDGTFRVSSTPFYRMAKVPESALSTALQSWGEVAHVECGIVDYYYEEFRAEDERFGFWVLSGENHADAMKRLVNGYRRPL